MVIKRAADDFVVDELLSDSARRAVHPRRGPFALYRLVKEGLNTAEAATQLAGRLRVDERDVVFVGLKDKYARTSQHMSVRLPANAPEPPASVAGTRWSAQRLGYLDRPITSAIIGANRFRIVMHGLTRANCTTMDQSVRLLSAPGAPGPAGNVRVRFVNYFGDQRFGSVRHGRGFVARHLIAGRFEDALRLAIAAPAKQDSSRVKRTRGEISQRWGRWDKLVEKLPPCPECKVIEYLAKGATGDADFRGAFTALPYLIQQLHVYAYQSYLWNTIAYRVIAQQCRNRGPVYVADDPYGELLFPSVQATPEHLVDLDLPILGRGTQLKEPWALAAESVLRDEKIASLRELRIPGLQRPFFGESPRRLLVEAEHFTLGPPQRDPANAQALSRVTSFDLPRGAYATVMLRALGQ